MNSAPVMPWGRGACSAVGSMPGTDADESARVVLGELPALPHLVELPARGAGADIVGRSAAVLVDLPVELVPSGYRVAARPGVDHRRIVDLMRRDVDALHDAVDRLAVAPPALKLQVAGPWTLTAGIELARGHRVLTDPGALREFADSLVEGVAAQAAELTARTGAPVVVQFDEPSLPTVLAGGLPTPSGFGTVPAPEPERIAELLRSVLDATRAATGTPVIVHCCANRPPVGLLRSAGADALGLDATVLGGAPAALSDEIGEAVDAGTVLFLGVVPGTTPPRPVTLHDAARPALALWDRLGFPRTSLPDLVVPTPACGLAGADATWARRALGLVRDLGRAFVEPPEGW